MAHYMCILFLTHPVHVYGHGKLDLKFVYGKAEK